MAKWSKILINRGPSSGILKVALLDSIDGPTQTIASIDASATTAMSTGCYPHDSGLGAYLRESLLFRRFGTKTAKSKMRHLRAIYGVIGQLSMSNNHTAVFLQCKLNIRVQGLDSVFTPTASKVLEQYPTLYALLTAQLECFDSTTQKRKSAPAKEHFLQVEGIDQQKVTKEDLSLVLVEFVRIATQLRHDKLRITEV
ncbi:hypothetical protein MIR68_006915 [Amoeboaphelidium protococcarum]|nr:hypothetical protein MIR68_006915 [Amoeboaphelidium protococcarum]